MVWVKNEVQSGVPFLTRPYMHHTGMRVVSIFTTTFHTLTCCATLFTRHTALYINMKPDVLIITCSSLLGPLSSSNMDIHTQSGSPVIYNKLQPCVFPQDLSLEWGDRCLCSCHGEGCPLVREHRSCRTIHITLSESH